MFQRKIIVDVMVTTEYLNRVLGFFGVERDFTVSSAYNDDTVHRISFFKKHPRRDKNVMQQLTQEIESVWPNAVVYWNIQDMMSVVIMR